MEIENETDGAVYIVESIDTKNATLNGNHELCGITLVVTAEILQIEQLGPEAVKKILEHQH